MSRFELPDISERLLDQFSPKLEGAISFKVLRALGRTGITASNETDKNRQQLQLDKLIEGEHSLHLSIGCDERSSQGNKQRYI